MSSPENSISKIDPLKLPRHIAIIMDGNGRWASKKRLPRIAGHHAGVKTVDKVVTFCRETGIEALTLYSFSSENWLRPKDEVSALMGILREFLIKELGRMLQENIRFNTIGRVDDLPDYAKDVVADAIEKTKDNDGMVLTLALSYGSRDEMTRAIRNIAEDIKEGVIETDDIVEEKISSYLDTADIPDPDLMIRTSGEERISNFMLWQMAYTELYFTEKLWPDFSEEDIASAIVSFQQRERRFGKTTEQMTGKRG